MEALAEIKQMMGEIKSGVEGLHAKHESLEDRITAVETSARERRGKATLPGLEETIKEGRSKKNAQEFSLVKMINAIASKDWRHAQFERDVVIETHKAAGGASFAEVVDENGAPIAREGAENKALGTTPDSAGGFLVPTQVLAQLIELLRSKVVVEELGATVLTDLVGSPVEIPKQTGGATAFWVSESGVITDSQQTWGQVKLRPHEAAALTKMSNRVLRLSNPSIEKLVRNDLMKVLARLIDLAALRGSGASNEPVGIANESGINTLSFGTAGGPVTPEKLFDMILEIENDDASGDSMGWAFHPKIWNKIRKLRTDSGAGAGTGEFFYNQNDLTQNPNKGVLLGMPYRTTTQIPTNLTEGTGANLSEIYLGNWEDLLWGLWGAMEILASRETSDAFERNQTWVRIIQEVDIGVRHSEAFVLANDVETV